MLCGYAFKKKNPYLLETHNGIWDLFQNNTGGRKQGEKIAETRLVMK